MKRTPQLILGVAIAIVSFLANPHGPLGGFWPPDAMASEPSALQLPFFLFLNICESLALAFAVVLLVSAYPRKAVGSLSLTQTRFGFVSLMWFLGNWWAHDSLHIHNGMNLQGLLYIEYGFHVTMMAAAGYLVYCTTRLSGSARTSDGR